MIIAFESPQAGVIPVLLVDTTRQDPVLRFLGGEEHYSIHQDVDGLKMTHFFPHEDLSSNDQLRVDIARETMPMERAARHGQYAQNRPLVRLDNQSGYELGGRLIDLSTLNPRQRYFDNIDVTIQVPQDKFVLTTYFCTPDNDRPDMGNRFPTDIGDFCIEVSEPMTQ